MYIDFLIPWIGYILVYLWIAHCAVFILIDGGWKAWLLNSSGGIICCSAGYFAYLSDLLVMTHVLPYIGLGYMVLEYLSQWSSSEFVQQEDTFDSLVKNEVSPEVDLVTTHSIVSGGSVLDQEFIRNLARAGSPVRLVVPNDRKETL